MLPLLFSVLYVIAVLIFVKFLLGVVHFVCQIFQERHIRCGYRPPSLSPQILVLEEETLSEIDDPCL